MWELQPKTLYTFLSATEKTIKDKPAVVQAVVTANIEATRIMYTDRAKIIPILVKHTGYPEKILAESFDFLVKKCIWDANSGLCAERINFTANLMTKVGNIKEGKTPKYEDIVDATLRQEGDREARRVEGPGLPDGGVLAGAEHAGAACTAASAALRSQRTTMALPMSVAMRPHRRAATAASRKRGQDAMVGEAGAFPLRLCRADPDRLAARRALHQPDLLHLSDRKIAVAFYETTVSGELPYFLGAEPAGDALRARHRDRRRHSARRCDGARCAGSTGRSTCRSTRSTRRRWSRVVPLLVLWFGIYLKAKIIVVFLFAVFPVLINTYQGVRECDKNMLEVAQSFRSSEWRMWQDVLLPFAVPYILAGIRLAIGRGLIGMIIAEFYTTISGLGFMITKYANVFAMDKTFVPVIVLMVLGVSLTSLLKWVGRRIAPWSRADH